MFALRFDPGITILGFDNLVRHQADVALYYIFVKFTTDQALGREYGVVRIGHRLALCRLPGQDLAFIGKRDDGRRGAVTFTVFDNAGFTALHDCHAGIGGA